MGLTTSIHQKPPFFASYQNTRRLNGLQQVRRTTGRSPSRWERFDDAERVSEGARSEVLGVIRRIWWKLCGYFFRQACVLSVGGARECGEASLRENDPSAKADLFIFNNQKIECGGGEERRALATSALPAWCLYLFNYCWFIDFQADFVTPRALFEQHAPFGQLATTAHCPLNSHQKLALPSSVLSAVGGLLGCGASGGGGSWTYF